MKELKIVFEVMHVVDVDRVELDAYQQKSMARTWLNELRVTLSILGRPMIPT